MNYTSSKLFVRQPDDRIFLSFRMKEDLDEQKRAQDHLDEKDREIELLKSKLQQLVRYFKCICLNHLGFF